MNSASEQLSYFDADARLVWTMQRCKHRDMSPEEFAELGHPGSTVVVKPLPKINFAPAIGACGCLFYRLREIAKHFISSLYVDPVFVKTSQKRSFSLTEK